MDAEREDFISQLMDESRNICLSTGLRNHIVDVLSSQNFPINHLRILAESNISFFSPETNILGQVFEWNRAIGRIVYFSPKLMELPSDIKGVIAHELAHVFLQHGDELLSAGEASAIARRDEDEADKLAESWGFPVSEAYRNRL